MIQKTLELLEKLMTGYEMTPGELDNLLRDQISEDLYLDYKHGNELKKKRPTETIRQYLSGFANSAGGVLIVGVDENTWTVTGCSAPGGGDLAEWASRSITPIVSHFSPLPRFQVIKHSKGDVLIASTERSPNLIPCNEAGEHVYYLRLHDQTLKAPEYLVSDILLGKRQHPYLHITDLHLNGLQRPLERDSAMNLYFQPMFRCENQSLSWAEDMSLEIISWVKYPLVNNIFLSSHLLSHVEAQYPDGQEYSDLCDITHVKTGTSKVGPFDVAQFKELPSHTIPIRNHHGWYTPYTWKAAVYMLSKGSPPIWYQLTFHVDTRVLQLIDNRNFLSSEDDLLEIRRLSGERPIVAWGSPSEIAANNNFIPDRPTLPFCEGMFKSKLVAPVMLWVIQVAFAGEVVSILQPDFLLGESSSGG